jgi:hypothetical protein
MNQNGLLFYEVKGFCMWPFLNDGQKILVRKTGAGSVRPGDIVLYRSDNGLLCHRLARKEKKDGAWVFYCKPDTSWSSGAPVCENMVEGKVAAVIANNAIHSLETARGRVRAVIILGFLSPVFALLLRGYKKLSGLSDRHRREGGGQ